MLIRLRPNRHYVQFLLLVAVLMLFTLTVDGPLGVAMSVVSALPLIILGYPVVLSTLCRIPVLSVTDAGLRLPLMGVQLSWPQVTGTQLATRPRARGRGEIPVLVIHAADPDAVLRQVRPWLRPEARQYLARHGSPIVVSDPSLDHSLAQIQEAVSRHLPADGIRAAGPSPSRP